MTNILLIIVALLVTVAVAMLAAVLSALRKPPAVDLDRTLREEMRLARDENANAARALREEITATQANANQTLVTTLDNMGERQRRRLDDVAKSYADGQDRMRTLLETRLDVLQRGNEAKLDEMRRTVDEKLQSTLEKRLGESFKIVSERLEAVQQGLGEMRNLASDVGGLKRVLTNVKDRGTWGEYQLGAILAEILTPDQYARDFSPRDNRDHVEFAVRLPGQGEDSEHPVWLPIDSKFPKEDYERLLDAVERADAEQIKQSGKALGNAVRLAAKTIQEKYVEPPRTTDFGIMFLPSEGLYAEVLRQPGLVTEIQNTYRVTVAGPTTISALLTSLRIGFQTVAIEKRSHEVWKVLAAFKTEFGKFGEVLKNVQKKLNEASSALDKSAVRTRAMQRVLKNVEQLPAGEVDALLGAPAVDAADEEPDEDGPADVGLT